MTINCAGSLLYFKDPKIMGIVNLTPDSFYDRGKFNDELNVLKHVENLLKEGSDFIDVGGCSTRPGSKQPTEEEEIKRVTQPIRSIMKTFPNAKISIDTFRSEVARIAVEEGALMINDISGGMLDKKMFSLLAKLKIPYILNHMKGTPENMQKNPYYNNTIIEINHFFSKKIFLLKKYGINDIILDPGFGFGKTIQQNFQLLKHLSLLGFEDHLILVGISRKSMIQNLLNISAKESLNATSIIHTLALLNGIKLLRVHDVKEAVECVRLIQYYRKIL
ncbi:MAG: dihydropteroate synthase [Flavobacteriales bacterium]|jgi:dihydropteroate synthase|uniref:dihydropteroate synthase n=1 Tax=Blattabacterium sp. (Mastotermes darwiniensis) TaxID=39768 RepID=UPI000231DEE9|nr:dihydropteroate synthase [Blattabacterium sp. (Mastotermes darwiniensis)]AER40797.1 dihydropteroate synthase [Blattabacterium sp. (Mastotermes darwiniensis) str. MADAR]MDR1804642.1 dihydropteroate synthase [Flavobacteriales bacterium]